MVGFKHINLFMYYLLGHANKSYGWGHFWRLAVIWVGCVWQSDLPPKVTGLLTPCGVSCH